MAGTTCDCLECRLHRAVDGFYEDNGRRNPSTGVHIIDVDEVITKLATIAGALIAGLPERGQRRAALKFAHDAVDAGVKAARTGQLVPVAAESATEH